MSDWLQQKYINIVGTRLERFTRKGPNLFSYRCPHCGDSQKNKAKTRGFFYEKDGDFYCFCHNCGYSRRFDNFLKEFDYRLWTEFKAESIKEGRPGLIEPAKNPRFDGDAAHQELLTLPTITRLPPNHVARQYLQARQIPHEYLMTFRYAARLKAFTNRLIPEKFKNLERDYSYIVIPYFDRSGHFYGYNARSVGNDKSDPPRYIAISLNKDVPMVFGLDKVNFNQDVFATEGPFDSCFVENCVAATGSNFEKISLVVPSNRIVIIPDNERYSVQMRRKISKCIDQGFKIMFWPEGILEKDINDMIVKRSLTVPEINSIIRSNVYEGLRARTKLKFWSKV